MYKYSSVYGWDTIAEPKEYKKIPNYIIETHKEGKKQYRSEFAGREIKLVDYPGTVLSVESLSQGAYETPLPILLMASIARTQGNFCDVGANIGIYSVLATKTKPDLFVYAFEPLPAARQALTENLRANETFDRVKIETFARLLARKNER